MPQSLEQFAKNLLASGLPFAEHFEPFLRAVPKEKRPKDGEQLARMLVSEKKLTAWQAQQIYSGKGKTLVLGNYLVLDKLGQGGMGMVLRAEHRRMGRQVALKVLSPAITKSPEALRRFQREVQAAAKLNHPNIVLAYDADEAAGTHFLVMEYVQGSDLASLVRKNGVMSLEKALHCIIEAARGLEYAHEEGVVHRDIKPSNLLLDGKGRVKILDMGLARLDGAGGQQDELTGTGQIMGTVDYMAPEQAINTKSADARADIYSLGVTFWFLIAGRPMYGGETAVEKLMAHQTQGIPSLREQSGEVSSGVETVFRKMVAKLPKDRYQSMREVITALERCRTGEEEEIPEFQVVEDEDSRIDLFLRNISSPPSASGKPAAPRSVSGTQYEETIDTGRNPSETGSPRGGAATVATGPTVAPPESDAARKSPIGKQPVGDAAWWKQPAILVTAGLALLLVLALGSWQTYRWLASPAVRPNPPDPPKPDPNVPVTPFLPDVATLGERLTSPDYEWTTPESLGINGARRELGASLTDDELILVFSKDAKFHFAERSRREAPFSNAHPLPDSINTLPGLGEIGSISGDGLLFAFSAQGPGGEDIWISERRSRTEPFGAPKRLPEPINSTHSDREPVLSSDGLTLLLTSGRPAGRLAGSDILFYSRKSRVENFTGPQNAGKDVNTTNYVVADFLGRDGLTLISTVMISPPFLPRLHRRASTSESFGPGQSLGPPFDKIGASRAWFSPDGERMYFHSREIPGGPGDLDLWMIRRVKRGAGPANTSDEGNGLEFDGETSFVEIPKLTKFQAGGPMTVEAIVTPRRKPNSETILTCEDHALGAIFTWGGTWTGRFGVKQSSAGAEPVEVGKKVHVACVWDGRQCTLFVDGQAKSNFTTERAYSGLHPSVLLGAGRARGGPLHTPFKGAIHAVRFSKGAKYASPFGALRELKQETDTVALYRFDEGSGHVLRDSSPNKYDGTIYNAKWLNTGAPANPPLANKIVPHEKFPLLKGHQGSIRDIQFLRDGMRFVSVAWDGTVRLWNLETGQTSSLLDAANDKTLNCLAISPDETKLAVGGSNFKVYVRDFAANGLGRQVRLPLASIKSLAFSADGASLFVGDEPGILHEYRVSDLTPVPSPPKFFESPISVIVPHPDNERIFLGAPDAKEFVLWDRKKKEVVKRFAWTTQFQSVRSISLLAYARRIASTHSNSSVRIWGLDNGIELSAWPAHPGKAISTKHAFPLDNDRRYLTIGDDKAARLWDATSFEKLSEVTTEKLGTGEGAVSPDGQFLVTGAGWRLTLSAEYDDDQDLHVWRILREAEPGSLPMASTPHDLLNSPDYEWTEPQNLGAEVNSVEMDGSPALASDGATLYFESNRPNGQGGYDLWKCDRLPGGGWSAAINLGPNINNSSSEYGPAVSGNLLDFVFSSDKRGKPNEFRLWTARYSAAARSWENLRRISVAGEKLVGDVGGPELSSDGLTLLFHAHSSGRSDLDLWESTRATIDEQFGAAQPLATVNTQSFSEADPALSADGRVLILTRWTEGGKKNLWMASRATKADPWPAPKPLGLSASPTSHNQSATLSADGQTLIFSSDRPGGQGKSDLWMSRRVRKGASAPTNSKSTAIFNGKDLTGWDGSAEIWKVENGEIVGTRPTGELGKYLNLVSTRKDFRDFELSFRARTQGDPPQFTESGTIRFRVAAPGNMGVSLQRKALGMLFRIGESRNYSELTSPSKKAVESKGEAGYDLCRIKVVGNEVLVLVNGILTASLAYEGMPREGSIYFSMDATCKEMRIRDIEFREIPSSPEE